MRISSRTISDLPNGVKAPAYAREALREGVVHLGVGNFHRAHEALYLEEAMEAASSLDWGVCGVGILPSDRALHAALSNQDGLYTLVERDTEHTSARVVGSLKRMVFAPQDPEAVFEVLAAPETRIVSLTVTESGYCAHGANGLDFGRADVQHDFRKRWRPKTIYGYLAEGLDRRRLRGLGPLSVVSCDDLSDNGTVVRRALVDFASARSGELGRWVDDCVTFPCSLVDRITPPETESARDFVRTEYGIDDECPVVCERFRQWVIEDNFAAGRPPFEGAEVKLTGDVRPYEDAKLRLLDATHSAMGYLGYLAGYRFVHEVSVATEFDAYLTGLMEVEVTPLLRPVPGFDLEAYKRTLRQRFANSAIVDPLLRICADGSTKIPTFVLPSIRDALERHAPITRLCLCVAAWLRFLEGSDDAGRPIPIVDAGVLPLVDAIRTHGTDPRPALRLEGVFGALGRAPRFVEEVARLVRALHEQGAKATVIAVGEG